MAHGIQHPQTGSQVREVLKRQGPNGSGKAGRVDHKGGAGTSNKARGGKNAR
ncbi:MAG TPA: hypothetical protein VNU25_03250 [Candidatus Paceibacterota bacterium]|nr:hypothetical protein [Candidatus Paceibacterota bacterium]